MSEDPASWLELPYADRRLVVVLPDIAIDPTGTLISEALEQEQQGTREPSRIEKLQSLVRAGALGKLAGEWQGAVTQLMRRPRFTGHLLGERGDHAMAA
jgi:hypothetical protein